MKKIAIFGHARSGTSTLKNLLDEHSQINELLFEPLLHGDERIPLDVVPQTILKTKEEAVGFVRHWLEELNSSGFKHLVTTHYNEALLEEFSDFGVITIYRENLCQAALSCMMAFHTRKWFRDGEEYRERLKDFEVDLERFEQMLLEFEEAREVIKSIDVGLPLVYEDFYHELPTKETSRSKLRSIMRIKNSKLSEVFGYLGYKPEFTLQMQKFFSLKQNSHETYRLVKNIDDVQREFGGIFD